MIDTCANNLVNNITDYITHIINRYKIVIRIILHYINYTYNTDKYKIDENEYKDKWWQCIIGILYVIVVILFYNYV